MSEVRALDEQLSAAHKDLSNDNELPELLDRRDKLIAQREEAARQVELLNARIRDKLGSALTGSLPGWWVSTRPQMRRGYTIEPREVRALRIFQTATTVTHIPQGCGQ